MSQSPLSGFMKSWLRARKSDPGATQVSSDRLPPINVESIPEPQAHHDGNVPNESTLTSATDKGSNDPSVFNSFHVQQPVDKQTIEQLMKSIAARITAAPLNHRQYILVRSEHYFRLALESWEQLRACHFKASQKFSLAEWMHIHALLLYGRIQSVQMPFNANPVAQHNQIDLSTEVPVFEPLAIVLNAIGIVQDKETGITYIPDAMFPAESHRPLAAYTASEMQSILDGTMYDWQRSWKRVLQARHLRDSKYANYSQLSLARSSSELIFAIREKSEIISRIQQAPQVKRNSIVLDDYQYELDQLHELLEEARNAKDYTIRPPCLRIYDRAESTIKDASASTTDSRASESRIFDFTSNSHHTEHTSRYGSPEDNVEASSAISLEATEDASTQSTREIELPASMKLPMLSLQTRHDEVKPQYPLRSAMRKGSATLLQDLSSRSASLGPLEGSLMNIANSSDITLKNESPTKEAETEHSPHLSSKVACHTRDKTETSHESPKKSHRVQLAGTADASDYFVHFDARIWEEYQAFVDALRSTRLTKFSCLKRERNGSYAWMLPVKLTDARHSQDSSTQPSVQSPKYESPTSHSTPSLSTSSAPLHKQNLQIKLPRTSIPATEQALALLLQTSSLLPEISDSWHVVTKAELDMRQFVLDYINTGIFDLRIM